MRYVRITFGADLLNEGSNATRRIVGLKSLDLVSAELKRGRRDSIAEMLNPGCADDRRGDRPSHWPEARHAARVGVCRRASDRLWPSPVRLGLTRPGEIARTVAFVRRSTVPCANGSCCVKNYAL
jgi:hypothetical protein